MKLFFTKIGITICFMYSCFYIKPIFCGLGIKQYNTLDKAKDKNIIFNNLELQVIKGATVFSRIVNEAINKKSNSFECFSLLSRGSLVVNSIFKNAFQLDFTLGELLIFTAISLHNHSNFSSFPKSNMFDRSIGSKGRGLLQFTSLESYMKLNTVASVKYLDYRKTPYLLDEFSKTSIHDELRAFKIFYCSEIYNLSLNLSRFIDSVKRLNPPESTLMNEAMVRKIIDGRDEIESELELKAINRFKIYLKLEIATRKVMPGIEFSENLRKIDFFDIKSNVS